MAMTKLQLRREVSWPVYIGLMALTCVVFSLLTDKRATQRSVTGTVVEFRESEWISVANDQTDRRGFPIAVRGTTAYEGRADLKPGVPVTVWYRSVGERRLVADKVRVLPARR